MKIKILAITLFLLSSLTAVSQSKSETEKSIKETIEKYISAGFYYNKDQSKLCDICGSPMIVPFDNWLPGNMIDVEFEGCVMTLRKGDWYFSIQMDKVESLEWDFSKFSRRNCFIMRMSEENVVKNAHNVRCAAIEFLIYPSTYNGSSTDNSVLKSVHKDIVRYIDICGGMVN